MSYKDHDKFVPKFRTIKRATGEELDPSTTFTLVPERDSHAAKAIMAYADSVESEMPGLASDLRQRFGAFVS